MAYKSHNGSILSHFAVGRISIKTVESRLIFSQLRTCGSTMRAVFILFAIFGLTAVGAGEASQPETYAASRILGGEPVPITSHNYTISLRTLNGVHFCSGFIYNVRWMITTATCVRHRSVQDFTAVMATDSLEYGTTRYIEHIEYHPNYKESLLMNNIALLRAADRTTDFIVGDVLRISDRVAPAGTVAWVTGWGRTSVMTFLN